MEIFLPIMFGIAIVEACISGCWRSFYFRYGIPIFGLSLDFVDVRDISTDWLNWYYGGSSFAAPIVFRRLSKTEIAFREKIFAFRVQFDVHGIIRHKEGPCAKAQIVAHLSWTPALFVFGLWLIARDWGFTLLSVAFLASLCLFPFIRLKTLSKLIQREFAS